MIGKNMMPFQELPPDCEITRFGGILVSFDIVTVRLRNSPHLVYLRGDHFPEIAPRDLSFQNLVVDNQEQIDVLFALALTLISQNDDLYGHQIETLQAKWDEITPPILGAT